MVLLTFVILIVFKSGADVPERPGASRSHKWAFNRLDESVKYEAEHTV
ncbi:hypothetical protein ACODNH_00875 (plasmid) [Haloarcula sp. NS06]